MRPEKVKKNPFRLLQKESGMGYIEPLIETQGSTLYLQATLIAVEAIDIENRLWTTI